MSIEASDVLLYLSEGNSTAPVARAARKFAADRPLDFAALAAFHAHSPYGVKRTVKRTREGDGLGLTAVGALVGIGPADAVPVYADALLRLDEWLLRKGYRPEERDRRQLAWDIEETAK